MAARVIVYKSRMTKTMRRTKILCPPLFLFLEENDKSEPVANRHYKVRIIIIWYTKTPPCAYRTGGRFGVFVYGETADAPCTPLNERNAVYPPICRDSNHAGIGEDF